MTRWHTLAHQAPSLAAFGADQFSSGVAILGTLRIGPRRVTVLVVDGLSLRVTPLDAIDCKPVIDLRPVMMSQ